MTSVAASLFAPLTASPALIGGGIATQPDPAAFGTILAITPAGPTLAAMAMSDLGPPVTPMTSLLATASVEPHPQVSSVTAKIIPTKQAPIIEADSEPVAVPIALPSVPIKQAPIAAPVDQPMPDPTPTPIAKVDPERDILVIQPSPASPILSQPPVFKTPIFKQQPLIEEAPDMPPTICPAAPDAPAEPTEGATKEATLPPISQPLPRSRRAEAPPIISTLAPPAPAPDSIDDATARNAEQAKVETSKADLPKADRVADDALPTITRDMPAILVLPATVITPVAPATPIAVAEQPPSAPDAKTTAIPGRRTARPELHVTAGLTEPVASAQVAPVESRGDKPDTGPGSDRPSPSRPAPTTSKSAEIATAREASPSFTPATLTPAAHSAALEIAKAPIATIAAQPGRIGQELGVAIAHHVASGNAATGGGETITLRLNPVNMGRIEVKLSFDDSGTLRAVVSADNPAALDMLRRDGADLGRALTDAGVRADAQTLRFDTRSGAGQQGGQSGQSGRQSDHGQPWQRQSNDTIADTADDIIAAYRPLRTRGGIDMVA